MKKYFVLSVLACCLCLGVQASPSPVEAVYGLIERIIPGYGKQFELELVEASGGKDVYGISSRDGKVLLKGNNAVSLATAFNQYLKYTCICLNGCLCRKRKCMGLSMGGIACI